MRITLVRHATLLVELDERRLLVDPMLDDEMNLLIVPVVVGQGMRQFPDAGPDIALDLGRLASLPEGRNDPGLPAGRAPAVCILKHVR